MREQCGGHVAADRGGRGEGVEIRLGFRVIKLGVRCLHARYAPVYACVCPASHAMRLEVNLTCHACTSPDNQLEANGINLAASAVVAVAAQRLHEGPTGRVAKRLLTCGDFGSRIVRTLLCSLPATHCQAGPEPNAVVRTQQNRVGRQSGIH